LGGATQQLIEALMGKPIPNDFCLPTKAHPYYLRPPTRERIPAGDSIVERETLWKVFCGHGIDSLTKNNLLSQEENIRLFQTTVLDEVIQTVLIGLSRVYRSRNAP